MLQQVVCDFPELVYNVRGMGLYQGFSLKHVEHKRALVQRALEEEGLLLLGAGTRSIRLRPNLNVTERDVDDLGLRLRRLLAKW
jgi:L-lysine 6-transaminase